MEMYVEIQESVVPEHRGSNPTIDKAEVLHDVLETGLTTDFSIEALIDWSET